ncbi:hypothetical protein Tco_0296795 [Tanacetum coccineum]
MDSIILLGQKNTLAEYMILPGADNRPPMLDKDLYDSWKSRMELYMQNREYGRMILESVENGLLIWPTIEENGVTRTKKYVELYAAEKIQADCDMKATNIFLQGLLADIYSLVNHHRVAKDLWERDQLLMQGTSLTKQERECKMYDAFDKFTHIKEESLHKYYLRFTQLINDMNIDNMKMEQFQVNTKFLNSLPSEWSKFVTDVKLVKDLHTTNFDQLHAYLKQHKLHANEVCLLRERNQDPLAFVSQMNHQTSSVPQNANQSPQVTTQPMTESPLVDFRFVVPVFSLGDDPIACINKAIAFLTVVASSRFPSTNNQLRTSSNPRNQATIQDGRVIVQQVQGRQGQSYSSTGYKSNATSSRGNNASGQARFVKCYNFQGEAHMARQCTQPKRLRNAAWYKDKAMLAKDQEARQILDEEQLAFLADPGVRDGQAVQKIIPNNAAFQTEDLDTYDSDCDDISNEKAVLMANISNYGSDVISEVPHSEFYINDMENQSVHGMQDFEQPPTVDFTDSKILVIAISFRTLNICKKHNRQICREKIIDSQMDDLIKENLALKEKVDSLEQNLSKQIKEKECLLQTFTVFKSESKEKEDKYMENEIDLGKKIKELDNILFKVGQSAQTVHMLTKPQAFYDNIHKKALGYQNPFHLKKSQWIKPTLYDGIFISDKHVAMPMIEDEETLILEENNFRKRFTPQQEWDAKQAFWFCISNPTIESSNPPTVKVEVPRELPKVSLVNASLKNLKFHLAQFDFVVKKRTTPDARTKVDKQCLEIAKKELFLENDRILQQIMSQEVLLTVMNSMSVIGESVNMDRKRKQSCDKCFNLEAELLKSQNVHNDLLKSYSQLEKHCISLELSIQLNQEIFQKDESCNNQNALEIPEFFENNDLKAQLQYKDSTICKLKDIIKSMRQKSKEDNVKYDYSEIETKNVDIENRMAKLL